MASMTRRSPWPMFTDISWLLKSRILRAVGRVQPDALGAIDGDGVDGALHRPREERVLAIEGDDLVGSSAPRLPYRYPWDLLLARRRRSIRLARHAVRALAPITAHPVPRGERVAALVSPARAPSVRLAGRTPPTSRADAGHRRSRSAGRAPPRPGPRGRRGGSRCRPARRPSRAAPRRHAAPSSRDRPPTTMRSSRPSVGSSG